MSAGNNRKENKFKKKDSEAELLEESVITDEVVTEKEEKKKDKDKDKDKGKKLKDNEKQKKDKDTQAKENTKDKDSRLKRVVGILFLCLAVFLGFAFISYLVSFYNGPYQEFGNQIFNNDVHIENKTGSAGVFLAQTLIKESFGIGSFFFVYLLSVIGLWLAFDSKLKLWNIWRYALLSLVWVPLFFGFLSSPANGIKSCAMLGGAVGRWLNNILDTYTGYVGVLLILIFLFLVFAIYQFNLTLNYFKDRREKREDERRRQAALIAEQRIKEELEWEKNNLNNGKEDLDPDSFDAKDDLDPDSIDDEEDNGSHLPPATSFTKDPTFIIVNPEDDPQQPKGKDNTIIRPKDTESTEVNLNPIVTTEENDAKPQDAVPVKSDKEAEKVELVIENTPKEEIVDKGKNMEHHAIDTPFDPRYELRDYKFPT